MAVWMVAACNRATEFQFTVGGGDHAFIDCPVMIDLEVRDIHDPEGLWLYEISDSGRHILPFQYEYSGEGRYLWFVVSGILNAGDERTYILSAQRPDPAPDQEPVSLDQTHDELIIRDGSRKVLSYRTSEKMPPEGVDSLFRRSAYIHPLWSPSGDVLTQIQPLDHYHHYGIWGPWTKTHVNGREVDYWNLGKGEGTVRFVEFGFIRGGNVFGLFGARQDHIDFGAGMPERVNIVENYYVRYWKYAESSRAYIVDIRSELSNQLTDTILFDAYRYGGGIGYRATKAWNGQNSSILTSEGLTREEADGTRARWCIVQGASSAAEGRSGILFLSHPANREHPEPMRVWPESAHDGQIFFEFCPIRHHEWVIVPGERYELQYRLVVYDGEMTPEEAEMHWNGFAYLPEVRWEFGV